jgi:ABC-type antimicrobial peptide transport system permease subunit
MGMYPYVPGELTVVLRLGEGAGDVVADARAVVRELDAKVPFSQVRTLDDVLAAATARLRLVTLLSGLAALAALVLGMTGVYGIVAYSVSQRTAEIGLRMALGSTSPEVERLVLGQAARIALFGVVGGVAAGYALASVLRGHLYEVGPADPISYAGAVLVVVAVVLAAGWLPARRAGRLDVVEALQAQ